MEQRSLPNSGVKSWRPLEAQEQKALIQWTEYNMQRYPQLEMLYHIPNGGSRNKAEAAGLKRQGVKSGVPDLCLAAPSGDHHGLYIEMKRKGGKTSENQERWIANLKRHGYRVEVAFNCEQAIDVIINYLGR